jgi:alpha-glucosidase
MNRIHYPLLIILLFLALNGQTYAQTPTTGKKNSTHLFVHPGILFSQTSLEHIRQVVENKTMPEYGSYELLKNQPLASADYKMNGPYTVISRDGQYAFTKSKMEADFSAAYLNALMWIATKEERHAKKSLEILSAYADSLKTIPSTNDAPLLVGLEGTKIVNAMEILRYTYKGIDARELTKITKMITNIFLPVCETFYATKAYTNGNWGPIVTKLYISAAIYLDNKPMYAKAIDFYRNANDNGTIQNYISGTTGQIQESGRDQGHSQLGIGALATVCEIAYNQGDDLYEALDNRLLKGFEYVAKYNLGYDDLPFETWKDVTGKYSDWTVISDKSRGHFIPIYEMAYNHYVRRKGLSMPYTEEVINRIRPEGYDRDQPAFGTLLFYTRSAPEQVNKSIIVDAPNKQTRMELRIDKLGKLQYRIRFSGKETVTWSDLGLEFKGMVNGEKTTIRSNERKRCYERFAWPLGENDSITNSYNELKINCSSDSLEYSLIVRVYDGSVAFRYAIPKKVGAISKENTTFQFKKSFSLYQYNQESTFTPVVVDTFSKTCDFPATLQTANGFITIGEAENDSYTKAELKKGELPNSLAVAFIRDKEVAVDDAFQTPWRTISFSKTAIGLHQYSELFLKLVPNPRKEIPTWIKPGKLIRAQLNTQSGIECIDFAVKHHFQYIMFDAGWYGAEFRGSSDPTQVIPQIDMPKVIQYGKDNGIGVILYVNQVGLKAKLDTILPLYKAWGVQGLKFGFVDGLTQNGIKWLVSAIKKVNEYGFILDIHDNYKPTGLSRMYPALLTQEGIRGDENSPDAFHTTVLPFTRFLAGPADFTFCYPNEKNSYSKNLKVSKAQQLALTVVFFSPLQSMFWYGRPLEYTNEAEIEFFNLVPTVWNESHYLAGDIGQNISVARRHGDTWFVGNVAGLNDWKSKVTLGFLTKGKTYTATVYEDDGKGGLRKRTLEVKKGDVFPLDIKATCGQALLIHEIEN